MNPAALAAAVAEWQSSGRARVPDVLDAEGCAAARAAIRGQPLTPVVQPGGWLWFEAAEVDPALLARVAEVARAVVGLDVEVGYASVRHFPRGAWADLDPREVGLVGFALDLSEAGVIGGGRRFLDAVWPPTAGELALWWEDGVTPVAVDLVHGGERVEIVGGLGVPR